MQRPLFWMGPGSSQWYLMFQAALLTSFLNSRVSCSGACAPAGVHVQSSVRLSAPCCCGPALLAGGAAVGEPGKADSSKPVPPCTIHALLTEFCTEETQPELRICTDRLLQTLHGTLAGIQCI